MLSHKLSSFFCYSCGLLLNPENEDEEDEYADESEEEEEESEEDLTEVPVHSPTRPPYILIPPPPVWGQRNQGLSESVSLVMWQNVNNAVVCSVICTARKTECEV